MVEMVGRSLSCFMHPCIDIYVHLYSNIQLVSSYRVRKRIWENILRWNNDKNDFWPIFGTIGKPCQSTFRSTLLFFNISRIGCIYEMKAEATSIFSVPFFCLHHFNMAFSLKKLTQASAVNLKCLCVFSISTSFVRLILSKKKQLIFFVGGGKIIFLFRVWKR